jgi:hypothetical protein
MTEMFIVAGKHTCGREMDMRMIDDKTGRPFWILYGICKKCEVVLVSNIFMDKEPIQDVDYIIDYNLISEEGTKSKDMRIHEEKK